MGKSYKKSRRKKSTKLTGNQSEPLAPASAHNIQATGGIEETATPSYGILESDLAEALIKGLVEGIVECMRVQIGFREMTSSQREELSETAKLNILTLHALNSNLNRLLKDKDPKFVENVEKYITLQSELKILKDKVSSAKKIETLIKSESSNKSEKSIKWYDSNDKVIIETSELFYGTNEKKIGDDETPNQETLNSKKIDKNISQAKHSNKIHKMDYQKYRAFDSSQPDLGEVLGCLDSKLDRYERKRRAVELAVKLWRETQSSISPKKEIAAATPKFKNDDIAKEKEQDLIQELEPADIEKKKKMASKYTDKIQRSKYSEEITSKEKTDLKDKTGNFQTAQHTENNVIKGKKGLIRNSEENVDKSEMDEWKKQATIISKEAADQENDLIKELETVEVGKKDNQECETSAEENLTETHSPGNVTRYPGATDIDGNNGEIPPDELYTKNFLENKMKEKTGLSKSTGDIQTAGQHTESNVFKGKKGLIRNSAENLDTVSSEMDEWKNQATRISKEAADQANDLIKELETVKIDKKHKQDCQKSSEENLTETHSPGNVTRNPGATDMDGNNGEIPPGELYTKNISEDKKSKDTDYSKSTGDVQRAGFSPKNLSEDKKSNETDCSNSAGDIQIDDSLVDALPGIIADTTTQRNDMGQQVEEKRYLEKRLQKPKSPKEIRLDLKKFLMHQNLKLDKQMKEFGLVDSRPKLLKELDLSIKKDFATTKIQKQFDTSRPEDLDLSKTKDVPTAENKKQVDINRPEHIVISKEKVVLATENKKQVDTSRHEDPVLSTKRDVPKAENKKQADTSRPEDPVLSTKKDVPTTEIQKQVHTSCPEDPDLSKTKDVPTTENKMQVDISTPKEPDVSTKEDEKTSENKNQFDTSRPTNSEANLIAGKQDLTTDCSKIQCILFDYQDKVRHITAGQDEIFYNSDYKSKYSYRFKEEKVEVCFSGDHLYVSTESSEFDIFFREIQFSDFKDDTTQTDAAQ